MLNTVNFLQYSFKKKHILIIDFSLFLVLTYFFIRTIDCLFLIPFPIGDEPVYVKEFDYFLENGLVNSIKNGMSIPFIIFSYFIHILTGLGQFSLRIAGLFQLYVLYYTFT